MATLDPSAPPVATGPTPFPGTSLAWSRPNGETLLEAVKHKLAEYGWSCPEYDGGTTGNMRQEWKVLITNAKQKPGANALGPRPKTVNSVGVYKLDTYIAKIIIVITIRLRGH